MRISAQEGTWEIRTVKKRPYFRTQRPRKNPENRRPDESLFAPARAAVLTVLEETVDQLNGQCTPGYPLVDSSARRCTLELSRDWSLTVRFLADRPAPALGLSTLVDGVESAENVVLINPDLAANLSASVSDFVHRYQAR